MGENEETLATHPDPRQKQNPDPRQRTRRQVTDVTDPTRFQARTMKLRANRILSVGVLVLLGLVLVSTQVAESRPDPDPQDLNEVELDTLVPDRKLLSTQVQAESEHFEAEPTRVLQGLPLYPPPSHGWLGGRRSLLGHGDEEVPLWVEDLPLRVLLSRFHGPVPRLRCWDERQEVLQEEEEQRHLRLREVPPRLWPWSWWQGQGRQGQRTLGRQALVGLMTAE